MCRSKKDGGQRCYSHATAALERAVSKGDPALVDQRRVELASTRQGYQETRQAARDQPDRAAYWNGIADQGHDLADRNYLVSRGHDRDTVDALPGRADPPVPDGERNLVDVADDARLNDSTRAARNGPGGFAPPERRRRRTDIHAAAHPDFDPSAYEQRGVFDTDPDPLTGGGPWQQKARMAAVSELVDAGYKHGPGSANECGHCGNGIRYAALMVREDRKEFVFVGKDCLDGRFSAGSKEEFKRLAAQAAVRREEQRLHHRIARTVEERPELEELTHANTPGSLLYEHGDEFTSEMAWTLSTRGSLTDRQADAAVAAIERARERQTREASDRERREKLLAAGVRAPEGKTAVSGRLLSAKWRESSDRYGRSVYTLKGLVESDEGWRVWTTIPASVRDVASREAEEESDRRQAAYREQLRAARDRGDDDPDIPEWKRASETDVLRGRRISFSATLARSENDELFAFATRPTQGKLDPAS